MVLVGPGNNGGDGLVTARHLQAWGARVEVYLTGRRPRDDPKLAAVFDRGVPVARGTEDWRLSGLRDSLASVEVVVDSVLGTGRARPIDGALKEMLLSLADARSGRRRPLLVALDMPSGLDADSGAVDPACPPADVTVSLGYPKVGLFRFPGAEYVGRLEIADIGLPPGLADDVALELMTADWARPALPERRGSAHKGTFGRTMVVAGSRNYVGAAYLAATAAARSGAGLVTLAIPESLQAPVAARAVEPTYLPLPESSPGIVASREAATLVLENLASYNALLVGCGVGQAPETKEFIERLLLSEAALPPTVVDADGLNLLAGFQDPRWWTRLPHLAIVTPHPGEMARLTGTGAGEIQEDRVDVAGRSAKEWNKVVVLKGAHSVVASPDGRTMLSPFANSGLASAGTGDVLAGAIAGLLSQGLGLETGAALGVHIQGLAGELVREDLGDAGMLASDVLAALPKAINETRRRG